MKFKFKERSINITPIKGIHLPVGKTTVFDCEMLKKSSDLADSPLVVKMKSQREDCLPQTLRVTLANGKIQMNVTNTAQGELHIYKGQNNGVVDLRSAGHTFDIIAFLLSFSTPFDICFGLKEMTD